jgi:hypothetical protein
MGQRLNAEIHYGDKCLANAYYHWSGYTSSAIHITERIISFFLNIKEADPYSLATEDDRTLTAIQILEATGAGITDPDRTEVMGSENISPTIKGYGINKATSINDGLIGLTERQMNITRQLEEGRVAIDILNETVNFDCWVFDTNEEYDKWYSDPDALSRDRRDKLPELKLDPTEIPFGKFKEFGDYICGLIDSCIYAIRSDDHMGVYEFIA